MTYKYTGEATVTFVDRGGSRPVFYLQDETAAIALSDDYEMLTKTDYEVGDKITGTILGVQSAFGTTSAMALGADLGTVVSKGNAVTPVEATLAQLKANAHRQEHSCSRHHTHRSVHIKQDTHHRSARHRGHRRAAAGRRASHNNQP